MRSAASDQLCQRITGTPGYTRIHPEGLTAMPDDRIIIVGHDYYVVPSRVGCEPSPVHGHLGGGEPIVKPAFDGSVLLFEGVIRRTQQSGYAFQAVSSPEKDRTDKEGRR